MTTFEEILYEIIGIINDTNLPIIFKGALVLNAACSSSEISRSTSDIDGDWVGTPPSADEIETKLNNIFCKAMPDISFVKTRDYIIGKRSAGFNILQNGIVISKIDLSICASSPSQTYNYAQVEFVGYNLNNILADKTSVLSSRKIFRRIKDFVDIYSILTTNDIFLEDVKKVLLQKNRKLDSFNEFYNNQHDLKRAYDLLKGVINKPDFYDVYTVLDKYVKGFSNNKNLLWSHMDLMWNKLII